MLWILLLLLQFLQLRLKYVLLHNLQYNDDVHQKQGQRLRL
jgi:hypothetical protein